MLRTCASALLLLIAATAPAIGQLITVSVIDTYEYEYRPKKHTVIISEKYLPEFRDEDYQEKRNKNYEANMEVVFKYLQEHNIDYKEIEEKKDPTLILPKGAIPLNGSKFELKTDRTNLERIEKLITGLDGLTFSNQDIFISIEDSFMKSCIDDLTQQAIVKANLFAKAMSRNVGELYEIKILKHRVNKQIKGRNHSITKDNKNSTHNATFEIQFSFTTL